MSAIPWWAWAIVAAAVGMAELHVPGSYFIWIALGAAITAAIDAAMGLSFEAQIVTFAVASALSCVAGYFVYPRFERAPRQAGPLNRRDLALVGARGSVCADFVDGRGKVKLGDSVWKAEAKARENLTEGTPIIVRATRDTSVIVEAAEAS
jgi:membrane protein implicated in regulation of membrane protease activity